jgi:ribosomal protein S18 acetylase RimI-like enzyme
MPGPTVSPAGTVRLSHPSKAPSARNLTRHGGRRRIVQSERPPLDGHNGRVEHQVTVRPGNAADIEAVLRLWLEAGAHPTSTDDAGALGALLERDPESLLVAELEGTPVGTLIATWDGWRGNMYRLAVLPGVRRRGIATTLVRAGERRLRSSGCRRISALVQPADPGAVDFWASAGYTTYPMDRYVVDIVDIVDTDGGAR